MGSLLRGCPLLVLAMLAPAQGKVFLTADEALQLAFPKAKVARVKHVLDEAQQRRIERLEGNAPERSMVYAYEAKLDGMSVGTAWFDRHRVRSKHELLMVVVAPDGKVARIEVLAFGEPVDYLPRDTFYAQFHGRVLDDELSTRRAIRNVAGATLTVNATTDAVRRLLAVHRVVYGKPAADAEREHGKGDGPKPSGKDG